MSEKPPDTTEPSDGSRAPSTARVLPFHPPACSIVGTAMGAFEVRPISRSGCAPHAGVWLATAEPRIAIDERAEDQIAAWSPLALA